MRPAQGAGGSAIAPGGVIDPGRRNFSGFGFVFRGIGNAGCMNASSHSCQDHSPVHPGGECTWMPSRTASSEGV